MEGKGKEGTAESFLSFGGGANINYADYIGTPFCDGKDTDKNKKGAATVDLLCNILICMLWLGRRPRQCVLILVRYILRT